jgi:hypothetical protein
VSRPVVVPIRERLAGKPISVTPTQLRTSCRRSDRDGAEPGSRSGLSVELIRPSPPQPSQRVRSTARSVCTKRSTEPTTVGYPHPSRQSFGTTRRVRYSGSHLGSTLKPGRAVLTRGVFRRSGSVACIRVAASPNEVLTRPMIHDSHDAGQCDLRRVAEILWIHYADAQLSASFRARDLRK